ncbi:MAG: YARHG domain-containing protein [Clostridiales bacterium]|nr:YARHG domain-containing protein [Clostridiales bacterium]
MASGTDPRFCMKCGAPLVPGDRFCMKCGAPVKKLDNGAAPRPVNNRAGGANDKKPGGNTGKIIAIVLGIIILAGVIGFGGYFVASKVLGAESTDEESEDRDYDRSSTRRTAEKDSKDEEKEEEQEEKAEEEHVEEEEESEYILPNSSSAYITEADLAGLSEWEIRVARNEVFARHGLMFKDSSLQSYFNGKSWYYGTVPAGTDMTSSLNQYEKSNIELISAYESAHHLNGK